MPSHPDVQLSLIVEQLRTILKTIDVKSISLPKPPHKIGEALVIQPLVFELAAKAMPPVVMKTGVGYIAVANVEPFRRRVELASQTGKPIRRVQALVIEGASTADIKATRVLIRTLSALVVGRGSAATRRQLLADAQAVLGPKAIRRNRATQSAPAAIIRGALHEKA